MLSMTATSRWSQKFRWRNLAGLEEAYDVRIEAEFGSHSSHPSFHSLRIVLVISRKSETRTFPATFHRKLFVRAVTYSRILIASATCRLRFAATFLPFSNNFHLRSFKIHVKTLRILERFVCMYCQIFCVPLYFLQFLSLTKPHFWRSFNRSPGKRSQTGAVFTT